MDPNVTLHLIRVELASHRERGDADVTALVHHVQALDDFLSNGGFLPRSWEPRSRALPDDGTRRFAHNGSTGVEAIQRELDAHPTWRGNDRVLAGEEAVRYKTERVRRAPARRNEATHPVELPDPADEAAFLAHHVDERGTHRAEVIPPTPEDEARDAIDEVQRELNAYLTWRGEA